MALNTALSVLRTMLKAEIGDNLSVGTAMDSTYNQLLESKQKMLVSEFDFTYLQLQWDVPVAAQGRYVAVPTQDTTGATTSIDFTREPSAYVFFNRLYIKLDYGIAAEQFNYLNSDLLQGVDPIQRWRWLQSGAGAANQKLEFWPVPQTAQTVRFYAQRAVSQLTGDTDTADIDDLLLTLSVAVEILARRKTADSQLRLADASRRLLQLRGAYPTKTSDPLVFGRGRADSPDSRRQRLAPMQIVAVHG